MQTANQQDRISQSAAEVTASSKEFVSEHAVSTALSVFGIGLGLGIALGCAFGGGSFRRQDEGTAHRLGRKMLDLLSNAVPDSLSSLGH